MYMQARPFGAPPGAAGPPPAPVLWLLTRLHPKMRARVKQAEKAFDEKLWRADLKEWDTVDRPEIVAKHRAIEAVDVAFLADEQLAAHINTAFDHLKLSHWMHHKYTAPSTLVVGDLLAGVMEWAGLEGGEVLPLIRGNSQVTLGFAATELTTAAAAIRSSLEARDVLADSGDAQAILDKLAGHPDVGVAVTAYLDAVRYRGMGYDVCDKNAGEMPESLVGALRSAVSGAASAPLDTVPEKRIRDLVPDSHKADFDERLAEARLMSRLRDERGVYSDGWATGLMRRALLEAGRRLSGRGLLHDAEHAVELTAKRQARCCVVAKARRPTRSPTGSCGARRTPPTTRRNSWAASLPVRPIRRSCRRPCAARDRAMGAMLAHAVRPERSGGRRDHGARHSGASGRLRGSGPDRRQQLGVRPDPAGRCPGRAMTSPYFNVVLPMLGAIVTDRGGALSPRRHRRARVRHSRRRRDA